ncbi:MAG: hypothetical protein U1E26_04375 [Coriobacteriia bacterium]|nr:hypothetical protein [Coriobacteriia bacterium]
MQYQSDYILRLIEQMGSLIRQALSRVGVRDSEESLELIDQAVVLALAVDPAVARRLAPESLAALIELNVTDDRVIALLAEALHAEAEILEGQAELMEASLRRSQAEAVQALLDPGRAN